ncbi:MAG: GTP-binding protein [Cytophagaceae bacterium]
MEEIRINDHISGRKIHTYQFRRLNRIFVFLQLQAKDVFRVKGVSYAGDEYKYVFLSVGSNLSMERGVEWKEGEERLSRIVFMGKNLQQKVFIRC